VNKQEIIDLLEESYQQIFGNPDGLSEFQKKYTKVAQASSELSSEEAFDIGVHAGMLWKDVEHQIIAESKKRRENRGKWNRDAKNKKKSQQKLPRNEY
jgi:hypothetical protein